MRPAPTVKPPSRIAKDEPRSSATGVINSTVKIDIVAGHDHFHAIGQGDRARHIHRADVELGPITGEEGFVAPAFVTAQDVDFAVEASYAG